MEEKVFFEEYEDIHYFSGSSKNWAMSSYHCHDLYEIILFMSDNAEVYIDKRKYKVNVGDLFIINSEEVHKTVAIDENEYKRYVLMFNPEILAGFVQGLPVNIFRYFEDRPDEFIHKVNLEDTNLNEVINIMNKIEDYYHENSTYSQIYMKVYIAELLVKIDNNFSFFSYDDTFKMMQWDSVELDDKENLQIKNKEDRIEQMKQYIEENLDEKLDLQTLADMFYLNKYYLSHYFKKETGFSVNKYILNRKISRAKWLLKENLAVSEVALEVGFSNYTYFINAFKREVGISPKQYAIQSLSQN